MSGGSRISGVGSHGESPGKAPAPRAVLQRAGAGGGRAYDPVPTPVRMYDCAFYDRCLDQAVHASWPSWTCEGCEAYEAAPLERLAHDVAGLLQIWVEATGESVIDGPSLVAARSRNPVR